VRWVGKVKSATHSIIRILYELYKLYELSTQQKKLISNNQKINKMKKSILSLVFISLFGLMSFAQGSLQFNQVKLVSSEETVPAGKVWKVESVMSSAPRKSFSPYFIIVNSTNIYFSNYSYSGKGWFDIAEIKIYYKENFSCTNTHSLIFNYHGYEDKTPFWGRTTSGTVQNNSNWHLVSTVLPQVSGSPLSITQARLYMNYAEAGDARLDITYMDGSTQSIIFPGRSTSICQSGSWQYVTTSIGNFSSTIGDYIDVPESELYIADTKLPLWLPTGTTLQAGDNVGYVSVIEFNVLP